MNHESVDLLAFGAHPDDVEIGMAGTIALHTQTGCKAAICDLTRAELSSNGTVETRQAEAENAGGILRLSARVNLELKDRGLLHSEDAVAKIVDVIRFYRPKTVFAPYPRDRHPDHGHCASLVKEAVFSAGIKKFEGLKALSPHRVNQLYYYFINGYDHPDVCVDISEVIETKMAALKAYESQFVKADGSVDTPLTNGYIETVTSRSRLFGKDVNAAYAEGFKTSQPILLKQLC